jgi:hypothetical protein
MLAELKPELGRFPVETNTIPAEARPENETEYLTGPVETAARPATSRSTSAVGANGVTLTPFY